MIDGVMLSPDQSEQQAVDCVSSVNGYASVGCSGGAQLGGGALRVVAAATAVLDGQL